MNQTAEIIKSVAPAFFSAAPLLAQRLPAASAVEVITVFGQAIAGFPVDPENLARNLGCLAQAAQDELDGDNSNLLFRAADAAEAILFCLHPIPDLAEARESAISALR